MDWIFVTQMNILRFENDQHSAHSPEKWSDNKDTELTAVLNAHIKLYKYN
jgi:hypothetical protein